MSITETVATHDEYLRYRALSVTAVASLILGVISLPAILFIKLLILPIIGLIVALYAVRSIRRAPDDISGMPFAKLGLSLNLAIIALGIGINGYVYATEVPEGYRRISFAELQPDPQAPQLPIPPSAIEMDGERIFVKGYVHPGVDRRRGIKQFVLVPDMKTCCFGGQPKLTDMIEVTLRDPHRIDYSYASRRLGGILKVTPYKKSVEGLDGVYYQLEADYVK